MKVVFELPPKIQIQACGTVCDRCGATQLDGVTADEDRRPAARPYVRVTVDPGPDGEVRRGHFCPSCDEGLRNERGGWWPYMRTVTHYTSDRGYRCYRVEVQDHATGQRRWIDSLFEDETLM